MDKINEENNKNEEMNRMNQDPPVHDPDKDPSNSENSGSNDEYKKAKNLFVFISDKVYNSQFGLVLVNPSHKLDLSLLNRPVCNQSIVVKWTKSSMKLQRERNS